MGNRKKYKTLGPNACYHIDDNQVPENMFLCFRKDELGLFFKRNKTYRKIEVSPSHPKTSIKYFWTDYYKIRHSPAWEGAWIDAEDILGCNYFSEIYSLPSHQKSR